MTDYDDYDDDDYGGYYFGVSDDGWQVKEHFIPLIDGSPASTGKTE